MTSEERGGWLSEVTTDHRNCNWPRSRGDAGLAGLFVMEINLTSHLVQSVSPAGGSEVRRGEVRGPGTASRAYLSNTERAVMFCEYFVQDRPSQTELS